MEIEPRKNKTVYLILVREVEFAYPGLFDDELAQLIAYAEKQLAQRGYRHVAVGAGITESTGQPAVAVRGLPVRARSGRDEFRIIINRKWQPTLSTYRTIARTMRRRLS